MNSPRFGAGLGRWLMGGTAHLGPLVAIAAGLVVMALALNGPHIAESASQSLATGDWTQGATWAALMLKTGLTALYFYPVLIAAYIAYGLADRQGLLPGFLGGVAAVGVEAGALGGLAAGVIAGGVTLALRRIPSHAALRELTSTVAVPLLAALVTAFVLYAVVGTGLSHLSVWLHVKLAELQFENLVVLGLALGLLSCCDLGGVISKTAFGFGSIMLEGTDPSKFGPLNMTIMAAVVAAGMVPPIGMSLATVVNGKLFSASERRFGRVSWLFGVASLPEGTMPFALADPLRVIPASMAGGAVTGALVMTFGAGISYPFGGAFAADLIGKPLLFAVAVGAGVLTTMLVTLGLKSLRRAERVTQTERAVGPRRKAVAAGRA